MALKQVWWDLNPIKTRLTEKSDTKTFFPPITQKDFFVEKMEVLSGPCFKNNKKGQRNISWINYYPRI